ncbi:MAG: hypothetical protein OHK0029_07520 [Armatimonadaceae bacterium]
MPEREEWHTFCKVSVRNEEARQAASSEDTPPATRRVLTLRGIGDFAAIRVRARTEFREERRVMAAGSDNRSSV